MSKPSDPRKPRVFAADDPDIVDSPDVEPASGEAHDDLDDIFDETSGDNTLMDGKRGWIAWGSLMVSAALALALMALGLWFTRFVSVAVWREDWVGWLAKGLFGVVLLAVIILIGRELVGIFRLSRLRALRKNANEAVASGDLKEEQRVVSRLRARVSSQPDMAWDVARFREQERHMREPGQLIGLADRVLLKRADAQAKAVVYQSSRRVGVVTTVVPIAAIVVLFVLFENLRMVRRLASAYGGRPGFFGGIRLLGWIVSHIAASGAIALTDDLFGQFFGQDMLRRLSRKLGEGAFNGAMTARLGVAALDVVRPLPFVEVKKPRARHIFYQAFPEMRPGEVVKKAIGLKGSNDRAQKSDKRESKDDS